MNFVYLKIPLTHNTGHGHEELHASQRHAELHQRLQEALLSSAVGRLLSFGDSVDGGSSATSLAPRFHRIDIEISSVAVGLAALHTLFLHLAVPLGSELHYSVDGQPLQQDLLASGWTPARPTPRHA